MQRINRLATATQALCLVAVISITTPPAAAGPLLNGSFVSFDGWSADIAPDPADPFESVDPSSDPRFSLEGGGFARLSNDVNYSDIVLYQDFDLAASASTLTFEYAWTLTASDPAAPDFVQATLWLADFSDFIDLFPDPPFTSSPSASGTATTDISAFAGAAVSLEFFLQDGDLQRQDWLEIGNIAIAEAIAEASLPSPLALMLIGLVPLFLYPLRGQALTALTGRWAGQTDAAG
ncbi:MAG: hypothetical protein V2J10_00710 [Wenzhouxiangella sp.]|nr:hypothetical protein [Wenzhouxiangella sp.]